MYIFENKNYTEEDLEKIADVKGYTFDELLKKNPSIKKTDPDPDDEGKKNPSQETPDATVKENNMASKLETSSLELENPKLTNFESYEDFESTPSKITPEGKIELRQRKREDGSDEVFEPVEFEEVIVTGEKIENDAANALVKLEIEDYRSPAEKLVKKLAEGVEPQDPATMSAARSIYNTTINALNQLSSVDEKAEYLGALIGSDIDLINNILGEKAGKKILKENQKRLSKANKRFDEINSYSLPTIGFTDIPGRKGFTGKLGGGVAGALNALSAFGTSIAISAPTFGVGLASDMISGSVKTFNDNKAARLGISFDELIKQGKGNLFVPAALGVFGYGLERAGIKGVSNSINAMSNPAKKGLYSLLNAGGKEGTTEYLQGGVEVFNEALGQGKNIDEAGNVVFNYLTSKEGFENLLQGAFGGVGMSAGGRFVKAASAIKTPAENQEIANLVTEYSSLEDQKYKRSLTQEERDILIKSQDNIKTQLTAQVKKNNVLVASMNENQIDNINNNLDLIRSIQKQERAINESGNLSEEAKASALNQLQKDKKLAQEQIFNERNEAERRASNINKIKELSKTEQNLEIKDFATTAEVEQYLKDNNFAKGKIKKAANQQGFFVQRPGEKDLIIINRQQSNKDNAVNVASHEYLHYILSKMMAKDSQSADRLGKMLDNYLNKIDSEQIESSEFKQRLEQYKNSPESERNEEVLTLFSDALVQGDLKFDSNIFTNLGDATRRFFQDLGVGIKFNTGKDVFNFIRDYNQSVEETRLTEGQRKLLNVEKNIEKENKNIFKESKNLTPEVTKDAENRIVELQKLKEKTTATAESLGKEYTPSAKEQRLQGELLNIIDPIVSKVAEQRTKDLYDKIPAEQKENVSREYYTESLKNDIFTFTINEFIENKQDLEKFIVNRGYLRSNALAKNLGIESTEEFGGPGITLDVTETADIAIEPEVAETVVQDELPKIKVAKRIFTPEEQTKLKEKVSRELPNITEEQLTFKTLPNLTAEVIAEKLNMPAKKLTGAANFTQDEFGRVQQFIKDNIKTVKLALPQAAVLEGEAVSEELIGTATNVPNKLLKNPKLYTRLERTTKKAGLVPYQKNKNIQDVDILEAIGIVDDKLTKGPRDPEAQTAKGVLNILGRTAANQEVREQGAQTEKISKSKETDLRAGVGDRILFSKSFAKTKKIDPQIIKLGKKLNTRLTKKAIDNALVEIRNEFDGTDELFLEYKEKYFDPYIEARKKADKMAWPNAEETVLKNIKTLEKSIPNLKITQVKLNKNSQKVDIEFELAGQEVFIEVKKNEKARLSQIFLRKNINGNTYVTKGRAEEKYINKIIKEDLKSRNILLDIIKEKYPNEIFEEKKGKDVTTVVTRDAFYGGLKALKKQNKSSEKVFQLPIDFVNSIYNAKNTYYLDFGDLGTFYMNENPQQFPVASLAQKNKDGKLIEVDVRMMWKRHKPRAAKKQIKGFKKPKTVFTISRIATPSLTAEAKQVLSDTETLSMQEEGQAAVILKFSKSKKDATRKNNSKLPKSKQAKKGSTNQLVLDNMKLIDEEINQRRKEFFDSEKLSQDFNKIIENKTGIAKEKKYSNSRAQTIGANKGRFKFFIPPSAEDFVGLLYPTLGKGKLGEQQMAWYKENLLDPYARAMSEISSARVALFEDYKTLKEDLKIIPKNLRKKIPGDDFTVEQAVRAYIWNKQGMEVPGLDNADIRELISYVANNNELVVFANNLIDINKGKGYPEPDAGWEAGTITTDLINSINTTRRAEALQQWQENADIIFSKDNLNKLQAVYGTGYRKALENILTRMKTGRNRGFNNDSLTGRFTDWINNSVGAIMFFNMRSALLQTISSVNFINYSDNNIFKAAKAFGNQKQYWSDFKFLFNSDFLKERRGGLRFNVSESDIADMAKEGGARGVLSKILQAGFLPTQAADSFAIASGGATFYRNRLNKYKKEGGKVEEELVYNASPKSFDKLGERTGLIYLATNKREAKAYADMNRGNVKNIYINKNQVASEKDLISTMEELGINTTEGSVYELIDPRFDNFYIGKDAMNKVTNALAEKGFKAAKYEDGAQVVSGKVESIVVFDKSIISDKKGTIKSGMTQEQAQEKAFLDFREVAEEAQQSSRPDRISAQQAGSLGRIILAFANTPAQYARLTKKALSDAVNNRGSRIENISKAIYYVAVQNFIFTALQNALFALAFDDEEEEDKKKEQKYLRMANSMSDSFLRGLGFAGAAVSTGKNVILKLIDESDKAEYKQKYGKALGLEVLGISPPVQSKVKKLVRAGDQYKYAKKAFDKDGFKFNSELYLPPANVISALTNVPLDRVVRKTDNLVNMTQADLAAWERAALFFGWQDWELGINDNKVTTSKSSTSSRSKPRSKSRSKSRSKTR